MSGGRLKICGSEMRSATTVDFNAFNFFFLPAPECEILHSFTDASLGSGNLLRVLHGICCERKVKGDDYDDDDDDGVCIDSGSGGVGVVYR